MRSITENLIQNDRSVCVKLMKQGIPEYDAEAVAILSQSQRYFCLQGFLHIQTIVFDTFIQLI